jgi:hypothetical protein
VPRPRQKERVIVAAIEKHARGDVEALARGIIEELRAAGLEIQRIDAILIRNPRRRATLTVCSAMSSIWASVRTNRQAMFGGPARGARPAPPCCGRGYRIRRARTNTATGYATASNRTSVSGIRTLWQGHANIVLKRRAAITFAGECVGGATEMQTISRCKAVAQARLAGTLFRGWPTCVLRQQRWSINQDRKSLKSRVKCPS